MRRGALFLVLAAFLFSCGGQWPVLQGLAWANMIREYSQVVPLGEAVKMTLSGRYPCALCKAIAERKSSADSKTFTLAKHDKPMVAQGVTLRPRAVAVTAGFGPAREKLLQFRTEAPPVPPPRLG